MKKAIKVPKTIDKETERYLGVLNEMHGQNLKGLKEGFILMEHRFDRVDKKFDEVNSKLDLHSRILNSHTEMIGTLMEDMSSVKSSLKKKVDYDEFLSLVKRVRNLESKR